MLMSPIIICIAIALHGKLNIEHNFPMDGMHFLLSAFIIFAYLLICNSIDLVWGGEGWSIVEKVSMLQMMHGLSKVCEILCADKNEPF